MNILVTGGAGFIGSNFILYFLKKHKEHTIINLDKLTYAGNLENLKSLKSSAYHFVKGDINNREIVEHIFREFNISHVINFAAESHVDRSILNPQIFLKTNILGTETLLSVAKSFWSNSKKNKFLQVSTDEVYGSLGKEGLFSEATPLSPHSPYSSSKASADLIVQAYHDTYGLPVNITRCSNNYGPYQFPEKLIPLMIHHALNHKKLPVYGDGRNVRDWLYVEDHCSAIETVLMNGTNGEVYNVGGNNEKENIEIVNIILKELNQITGDKKINKNLITYVKDRLGHDRRYAIDSSKIQKELGWKPKMTFSKGIVKTIKWYLKNQDWVNTVISGDYRNFYQKNYKK